MVEGLPEILVLVGPTASGKTSVSLPLAELIGAEIISADSRQVYRYMNIGTAKPTPAEQARVHHHFIDIRNPDEEYSAGEFGESGRREIDAIFGRGHTPLVVGGSGLYVRSLIDGLFEGPPSDHEYREYLEKKLAREGMSRLMEELRQVDPDYAGRVDATKPRRVIRALEVWHLTGIPISALHRERKTEIQFRAKLFGLSWERQMLYSRVTSRCAAMVEAGLLAEVEHLEQLGYTSRLNALNTVGYSEAIAMRRGELTAEHMVERFAMNSRRYAKRQLTWFHRDDRIQWVQMGEGRGVGETVEEIHASFCASGEKAK